MSSLGHPHRLTKWLSRSTNLHSQHWWASGGLHWRPHSCAERPAEGTASHYHSERWWLLPGTGCPEALLAGTWHWDWIQAQPHAWRSSAEAMLWARGEGNTHRADLNTQTYSKSQGLMITLMDQWLSWHHGQSNPRGSALINVYIHRIVRQSSLKNCK